MLRLNVPAGCSVSVFARLISSTILFALVGCGAGPTSSTPTLTSTEREREIGLEQAQKIEASMGLVEDRELVEYVERIGQRLVKALPEKQFNFTFKVVDQEMPNAFALPGGYIYISRGMLTYLNGEEELAGVLGHEIAHVAARHGVRQRTRGILTSPLGIASAVVGSATSIVLPRVGSLVAGVGQLPGELVLATFSREQEREADRIGMDLAAKAGWDPSGITRMLETLEAEERLVSGSVRNTGFLDSHPSTPERVEATRTMAATVQPANEEPFEGTQRGFYERLSGLRVGPDPASGVFVENVFMHADLGFKLQLPRKWNYMNSNSAVVAVSPDRKSVIALQSPGKGDDPMIAASRRRGDLPIDLDLVERIRVNGLPAARFTKDLRSRAGVRTLTVTWIVHRDRIYEIASDSPSSQRASTGRLLIQNSDSFDNLASEDREKIFGHELQVFTSQASEPLARLLDRISSSWSPAVAQVANGLEDLGSVPAGRSVKAPVRVPYRAGR